MSCADSVTLTCCLLTRLCYQHSCCQYSLSLLSSRFTHTFAIFFFIAVQQLSPGLKWISHSTSAHQILPQFLLSDKRHFLGKESSLLRSLLMLRVPGTLSGLSMPVCEIWLGLRAGFCLETFGKNGSSLRVNEEQPDILFCFWRRDRRKLWMRLLILFWIFISLSCNILLSSANVTYPFTILVFHFAHHCYFVCVSFITLLPVTAQETNLKRNLKLSSGALHHRRL